ncbi:MAG: O-antigen ligase family protein [Armatimonadetes bacterium]|nr:O-antigen ligase family protein [Armatimonadota bacterium]
MISESLRPSPLPPRRLNPLHWLLVLGALALLGASFFALDIPGVVILALGLGIAVACVQRFVTSFALFLGLSLSLSYDLLLNLRPTIGGSTLMVNALDFAALLVLISVLLSLIDRHESLALPRHLFIPYTVFALITVFGLAYGILANSGSFTTFLKDVRIFFALHICILGLAWMVRHPKQLRMIASVLVLAGFLCAMQQIGRLIIGGTSGGFGAVRDPTLPSPILVVAVMFIWSYRFHGLQLTPRNTYPFVLTLILFALLITFTRSVWAMMIVAYALGLHSMGGRQRARSLFAAMGMFVLIVFVVPFVLDLAAHGMSLQSLMEARLEHIMGKNDFARESRIITTVDAWFDYLQSPIWGFGLGYPIMVYTLEDQAVVEAEALHNSYLYYGIKIGGVGLLVLAWLIFAAVRRAVQTARTPATTPEQREVRAFAQALFTTAIPFVLLGPFSGNLNYIVFMPLLGLIIGIPWDRIEASVPPSPAPQPESGTPERAPAGLPL